MKDIAGAMPTPATLFGPCGYYNGSAVMRLANVSFLSGLTAMTVQFYAKPAAVMVGSSHGFLTVNTPDGTDATSSLCVQYLASSSAGANVIHVKFKTASGTAVAFSSQNIHSTNPQLVHVVFQDGSAPKIYVDGVNVTSATGAVAQNGGLSLGSGGLYVGAGPRDTASGGYVGLLDELRVYPAARSAGWIATEAASYLTPATFYGLGGEDLASDSNLACVPVPVTLSATIGTAQDIDVAAAAYDPEGGAKTIVGTPTITAGTVSIASNKLRANPSALPATASYVLQDSSAKQATGYARLRAASPVGDAYRWGHAFPAAGSVTAAMCKVWRVGQSMPAGYVRGDILLLVGGGSDLTNDFYGGGGLKGPIVPIGLSMRPRGFCRGTGHTAANPFLGVRSVFQFNFASDARSHATWYDEAGGTGRNWPFVFLANVDIDYQTNNCAWGDVIRVGTGGKQDNGPSPTFAFRGSKCAIFVNKLRLLRGPHYSSDNLDAGTTVNGISIASSENGHSDFIQSFGGCPVFRAADLDLDWVAGQCFFSGREADDCGWPRTTRWRLKNVALDHSAKWISYAPDHILLRQPQLIKATEEQATNPNSNPPDTTGENYDYASGKYMAVDLDNCYVRGRSPKSTWTTSLSGGGTGGVGKYLAGPGGITANLDGNQFYRFVATKPSGATANSFPAYSGTLKYLEQSQTLPQMCPSNHTGSALRLQGSTDADIIAQFISIIQA